MTATQTLIKAGPYSFAVVERGQGNPLVWLHGWEAPEQALVLDSLAGSRRVIAPVLPGYSHTEGSADLQDLHTLAVAYLSLLDALHVDQMDLAGHSLGAMLAAEIAALIPERVRRLVLVAPLGFWFDSAVLPDFVPSGGPALARVLWADQSSEAAQLAGLDPIERTANVAVSTNYLWPIPDRGLESRIHRVTMPTLLVRGQADGIISDAYLDQYLKKLSNGQSATIADAGHYPQLEQPEAFQQLIEPFLGGS